MRIYLVGYMASGKSGIGKELAKLMGYPFIDTDSVVQQRTGKSVSELFIEKGEAYFRKLEHDVLLDTAGMANIVVATGGGLPCHFEQMEWMNQHGITVYLQASAAALFSRLRNSREDRPLLKDVSEAQLLEIIRQHLEQREPYYLKANITVEALDLKARDLLAMIPTNDQSKNT